MPYSLLSVIETPSFLPLYATQAELDEEMESMRKEWLSEVSLTKDDMGKLLLQMGISLKETEMRALIDAFDVNCDGVITISEFLDFTGPKRDKRSGNSVVMSQRCCWLTTCKVTGKRTLLTCVAFLCTNMRSAVAN